MFHDLYVPTWRANNSGCRTQILGGLKQDSVYNRAGRAMQYIDIKYPRWRADFRRVASEFALVAQTRRMGATDVVQFIYYAAIGRAIRFVGGKMEVYAD